jgi:hypothetical protein
MTRPASRHRPAVPGLGGDLVLLRPRRGPPLHAQVSPNVSLSIANLATGVTRVVGSNDRGLYTAPNLVPGMYQVTATASGLARTVTKAITVTVGASRPST